MDTISVPQISTDILDLSLEVLLMQNRQRDYLFILNAFTLSNQLCTGVEMLEALGDGRWGIACLVIA